MGLAFVAAVCLLVAVGAAVALRPWSVRPVQAAALLFAGLIVAYAAATGAGIPVLSAQPEAVDAVALATKFAESIGLVFALKPSQAVSGTGRPQRRR